MDQFQPLDAMPETKDAKNALPKPEEVKGVIQKIQAELGKVEGAQIQ